MHRVVLDLNVVVSALIEGRGPSARVVRAALGGELEIVACPRWFAELAEVTSRPKFASRFSAEQAQAVIEGLLERAILREDPVPVGGLTRDPDDDYLVELAREAGCDALISGDADLRTQAAVRVVSPQQALEMLGGS